MRMQQSALSFALLLLTLGGGTDTVRTVRPVGLASGSSFGTALPDVLEMVSIPRLRGGAATDPASKNAGRKRAKTTGSGGSRGGGATRGSVRGRGGSKKPTRKQPVRKPPSRWGAVADNALGELCGDWGWGMDDHGGPTASLAAGVIGGKRSSREEGLPAEATLAAKASGPGAASLQGGADSKRKRDDGREETSADSPAALSPAPPPLSPTSVAVSPAAKAPSAPATGSRGSGAGDGSGPRGRGGRLALMAYQKAIEVDPTNVETAFKFGSYLQSCIGDIDGATELYLQALLNDPAHVPSLLNLARCHLEADQSAGAGQRVRDGGAKACDVYGTALALEPRNLEALLGRAQVLHKAYRSRGGGGGQEATDRLKEARSLFERAFAVVDEGFVDELQAHDGTGFEGLEDGGGVAILEERSDDAGERVVDTSSMCMYAAVLEDLADVSGDEGQGQGLLREADQVYGRVLEMAPDHVPAVYNQALLRDSRLKASGAAEDARKLYERCLQLQPDHYGALCNLGALYESQLNQVAKAREMYEAALRLQPADAGTLFNYAGLFEGTGASKDAFALYQRAVESNPRHVPSWLAVARLTRPSTVTGLLGPPVVGDEAIPNKQIANAESLHALALKSLEDMAMDSSSAGGKEFEREALLLYADMVCDHDLMADRQTTRAQAVYARVLDTSPDNAHALVASASLHLVDAVSDGREGLGGWGLNGVGAPSDALPLVLGAVRDLPQGLASDGFTLLSRPSFAGSLVPGYAAHGAGRGEEESSSAVGGFGFGSSCPVPPTGVLPSAMQRDEVQAARRLLARALDSISVMSVEEQAGVDEMKARALLLSCDVVQAFCIDAGEALDCTCPMDEGDELGGLGRDISVEHVDQQRTRFEERDRKTQEDAALGSLEDYLRNLLDRGDGALKFWAGLELQGLIELRSRRQGNRNVMGLPGYCLQVEEFSEWNGKGEGALGLCLRYARALHVAAAEAHESDCLWPPDWSQPASSQLPMTSTGLTPSIEALTPQPPAWVNDLAPPVGSVSPSPSCHTHGGQVCESVQEHDGRWRAVSEAYGHVLYRAHAMLLADAAEDQESKHRLDVERAGAIAVEQLACILLVYPWLDNAPSLTFLDSSQHPDPSLQSIGAWKVLELASEMTRARNLARSSREGRSDGYLSSPEWQAALAALFADCALAICPAARPTEIATGQGATNKESKRVMHENASAREELESSSVLRDGHDETLLPGMTTPLFPDIPVLGDSQQQFHFVTPRKQMHTVDGVGMEEMDGLEGEEGEEDSTTDVGQGEDENGNMLIYSPRPRAHWDRPLVLSSEDDDQDNAGVSVNVGGSDEVQEHGETTEIHGTPKSESPLPNGDLCASDLPHAMRRALEAVEMALAFLSGTKDGRERRRAGVRQDDDETCKLESATEIGLTAHLQCIRVMLRLGPTPNLTSAKVALSELLPMTLADPVARNSTNGRSQSPGLRCLLTLAHLLDADMSRAHGDVACSAAGGSDREGLLARSRQALAMFQVLDCDAQLLASVNSIFQPSDASICGGSATGQEEVLPASGAQGSGGLHPRVRVLEAILRNLRQKEADDAMLAEQALCLAVHQFPKHPDALTSLADWLHHRHLHIFSPIGCAGPEETGDDEEAKAALVALAEMVGQPLPDETCENQRRQDGQAGETRDESMGVEKAGGEGGGPAEDERRMEKEIVMAVDAMYFRALELNPRSTDALHGLALIRRTYLDDNPSAVVLLRRAVQTRYQRRVRRRDVHDARLLVNYATALHAATRDSRRIPSSWGAGDGITRCSALQACNESLAAAGAEEFAVGIGCKEGVPRSEMMAEAGAAVAEALAISPSDPYVNAACCVLTDDAEDEGTGESGHLGAQTSEGFLAAALSSPEVQDLNASVKALQEMLLSLLVSDPLPQ